MDTWTPLSFGPSFSSFGPLLCHCLIILNFMLNFIFRSPIPMFLHFNPLKSHVSMAPSPHHTQEQLRCRPAAAALGRCRDADPGTAQRRGAASAGAAAKRLERLPGAADSHVIFMYHVANNKDMLHPMSNPKVSWFRFWFIPKVGCWGAVEIGACMVARVYMWW